MATIDKVKVLVVGDSGVGKSSLTHLIAHNEPINNPAWTVGCSVEVKLHEFKEGTASQRTYFIELWDIGGSHNHRNTRPLFYNYVHGIILVHDLTNRKSHENLKYWLSEILNKEANSKNKQQQYFEDFDPEQFVGASTIPMLVIGTKSDLVGIHRLNHNDNVIGEDWGADTIHLNCRDSRCLSPGSISSVKLSKFLDKVIEVRSQQRDLMSLRSPPDKPRRFTSPGMPSYATSAASNPLTSYKNYHND